MTTIPGPAPAPILHLDDMPNHVRVLMPNDDLRRLIEDAEARATAAVPALTGDLDDTARAAARAVLRGAVTRAAERLTDRTMTAGPFTIGPAAPRTPSALLWPSELDELRRLTSTTTSTARWLA